MRRRRSSARFSRKAPSTRSSTKARMWTSPSSQSAIAAGTVAEFWVPTAAPSCRCVSGRTSRPNYPMLLFAMPAAPASATVPYRRSHLSTTGRAWTPGNASAAASASCSVPRMRLCWFRTSATCFCRCPGGPKPAYPGESAVFDVNQPAPTVARVQVPGPSATIRSSRSSCSRLGVKMPRPQVWRISSTVQNLPSSISAAFGPTAPSNSSS
jgi:hypothetical protein